MIDARGLSCPMPVVMVQKALHANDLAELTVLVDNQCAVENITRFASNRGYSVCVSEDGADFRLLLQK